jgi:YaaC-like Protein
MAIIDSKYIGSFQKGLRLTAENPLEEVWSRLGLYGSEDYLREGLTGVRDKQASADYIAVRMRQAIELRAATRQATLLTAPLTLYYSVLNLTLASMAIRDDILDSKRHGLIFRKAPQILASRAEVNDGTFSRYISVAGSTVKTGVQISLNDCLSRVIETSADYCMVTRDRAHACPVTVDISLGETFLKFRSDWAGGEQHFRSHWETEYPSLVAFCDLAPPGECSLRTENHRLKGGGFLSV